MKRAPAVKPSVLFLHNKYLKLGGEDSVVSNEIDLLKKEGYTVFYKEFDNAGFDKKNLLGSVTRGFQLFFNLSAFVSLYFFIRRNKIDVVHVHNFFYTASPSVFWAAKAAGATTVMTMHNYRLFCLNAILFRNGSTCTTCITEKSFREGIAHKCLKSSAPLSRALASATMFHRKIGTWRKKVDRFIVLNPFMKELLLGIGVEASNISVKPNFITDSDYNNYDERDAFYLYAGRLQEEKGIRHVIEAFNKSGKPLVIAGAGDMVDFIKATAGQNISYVGQKDRAELIPLLLKCRGLIFSSFLTEGMPMTIIEAHAAGAIPIVGSSVNTERMITNGDDGFLYDCGDPDFLNRQIDKLESLSITQLNAMSLNARKKFETYYHEKSHLAVIDALYTKQR